MFPPGGNFKTCESESIDPTQEVKCPLFLRPCDTFGASLMAPGVSIVPPAYTVRSAYRRREKGDCNISFNVTHRPIHAVPIEEKR